MKVTNGQVVAKVAVKVNIRIHMANPAVNFSPRAATRTTRSQQLQCCSRGYYQKHIGQTSCKICAAGKVEPVAGSQSAQKIACGYFCPAGSVSSTAEVCGEGFYCPTGTTSRQPIGSKQGIPVSNNPLLYCGVQDCPAGHACENGVAESILKWTTPAGCLSNLHLTSVDEGHVGTFGDDFSATPHHSFDNARYHVEYNVTKCPGKGKRFLQLAGTAGTMMATRIVQQVVIGSQ